VAEVAWAPEALEVLAEGVVVAEVAEGVVVAEVAEGVVVLAVVRHSKVRGLPVP
jgi:hypothetical protein